MITASCHCGKVTLELEAAPEQVTSCNCSICRRHAGLWGYYEPAKVKITARKGAIVRYIWGDKCLRLCRCATCGCITHWELAKHPRNRMGINFRNFDPSVIATTRIRRFDGAETWKFLD